MIEPTIGRVVWFTPPGHDPDTQIQAAIITYVHNERCVNIAAFNHSGTSYGVSNVTLLQDDDTGSVRGNYVSWMPYQKGQAARTEAAEKAASEAATT